MWGAGVQTLTPPSINMQTTCGWNNDQENNKPLFLGWGGGFLFSSPSTITRLFDRLWITGVSHSICQSVSVSISHCWVFLSSFGQLQTRRLVLTATCIFQTCSLKKSGWWKVDETQILIFYLDAVAQMGDSCLSWKFLSASSFQLFSNSTNSQQTLRITIFLNFHLDTQVFSFSFSFPCFLKMSLLRWSVCTMETTCRNKFDCTKSVREDHYLSKVSHREQLGNCQKASCCGCKWTPLNSALCM